MEKVFDIRAIMNYLPHRYPFILIDRVLKLVSREEIVALKNVSMNEPFFQGHFPGTPIMPGVLIIEALAQAGGILAYEALPAETHGGVVYFMGMDKVRFRKPVVPGDQLILEARILKFRRKVVKISGVAKVDNSLVAEAELMASFGGPS
ncbi:MAG: 3-hydroxyacyl-ACP dehydratase FabZ [Desulfobacterales bacterium]|nr:MAG: 3-hydroxyacyl-ACP dehydratase FabZ [Desulfobacterales bacterium]